MSEIVFNAPQSTPSELQSQIENFQTTLASLNQQVISLQEALLQRDQEIADLQMRLTQCNLEDGRSKEDSPQAPLHSDETLTIVGALINLYKFLVALPAQKGNS